MEREELIDKLVDSISYKIKVNKVKGQHLFIAKSKIKYGDNYLHVSVTLGKDTEVIAKYDTIDLTKIHVLSGDFVKKSQKNLLMKLFKGI